MKTSITKEEQKMLDELREKALTVLDYMHRNGLMGFHRVGLDVTPDFKKKPCINVSVSTDKGNEHRVVSMFQFQYSDIGWITNVIKWKGKEE